jgi:hypothetical protein
MAIMGGQRRPAHCRGPEAGIGASGLARVWTLGGGDAARRTSVVAGGSDIIGPAWHGEHQLGCGVKVKAVRHGGRRWCWAGDSGRRQHLSLFHIDSKCLCIGHVGRKFGCRYENKHVPRLANR